MIGFLVFYVSVYGAMQAYVWLWCRRAWPDSGTIHWIAGIWLVLMVAAPPGVIQLERTGLFWPARIVAYIGYSWMPISLWFLTLGLVTDVWNILAWALHRFGKLADLRPPAHYAVPAFAVIIACTGIWGYFEARAVGVSHFRVETPLMEPGSEPLRLVQISDVHLGLTLREDRLRHYLELVRAADPDVLVCTGDLVDASFDHLEAAASILADYDPPLGKYGVTGNHDYYAGLENSLRFFREAGFRVLREESVEVDDSLVFAGVDDPAGGRTGARSLMDEGAALPEGEPEKPVILLKHRPRVQEKSSTRFSLQLSGHSHGGQLFPFTLLADAYHRYDPGLHRLPAGSYLYVTSGTGTWGPPFRVGSPPEIAVFDLVHGPELRVSRSAD